MTDTFTPFAGSPVWRVPADEVHPELIDVLSALRDKQHMSNLIAAHAAFGSNIGSWPADIREGLGL